MHLEHEPKNGPGIPEVDNQELANLNTQNNNNNNSVNERLAEGESGDSPIRDHSEMSEDALSMNDSRMGPGLYHQEHPGERVIGLDTTNVEMGNLDERTIIADNEDTAFMLIRKSQENGNVPRPLLEKTKKPINVKQEGKKMYQYLSTLIAGLIAMQSGMTLGWTSPILPYLNSTESFIPNGLDDSRESWICSLLAVGAVLGAVPAGKIADVIGRKAAIIATSVPFLISWHILIFFRDLVSLLVARFIGGIGAGAACVLVPVYIGEVAEASIRGALGSFFPLLFSLGIVFVYVAGAYATYTTYNVACCLALLPFFALVFYLPESPLWLVHRNRMKQAAKSLEILRGKNYDPRMEINLLQIEADRLENRRGGMRDLLGTKAGRKAICTCVGLMWFQQMSGIDAVLFYTVTIFQDAGSTIEPHIATIIIGIVEVVMAIVVATVIDRFGRKPLLIMSGAGMAICLSVLGFYFKLKEDGTNVESIGWLPLTCIALFNVVFSLGYGSVPFAVISEMFPPETKGVASSISIMVNWSLVFAVTKIFPTMTEYMGQAATFWTFGCMTAVSAIFSYLFVPETKGKTLQEIQTKLEFGKKPVMLSTISNKESA